MKCIGLYITQSIHRLSVSIITDKTIENVNIFWYLILIIKIALDNRVSFDVITQTRINHCKQLAW